MIGGKWFEPRSLSHLSGLIVRVRVVPRRTAVGNIDQRFNNLSGSHHQSHVNCVSSVYGIYDCTNKVYYYYYYYLDLGCLHDPTLVKLVSASRS